MATLTIRLTDDAKADVERRAKVAGLDMTALVKRALDLERDAPDVSSVLEDHERRLSAIEALANL